MKYVFGLGCRIQLDVIRNPETAKNPSTPTCESNCVIGLAGISWPVNGQVCQRITEVARMRRHALSALLRGSNTRPSTAPPNPGPLDCTPKQDHPQPFHSRGEKGMNIGCLLST